VQTFNNFQEVVENRRDNWSYIENLDLISESSKVPPPSPIPKQDLGKHIPQWGQALEQKVNELEQKVDRGFAELRKDITEVNQKIDKIVQRLSEGTQ
jgi:hypothetical protein